LVAAELLFPALLLATLFLAMVFFAVLVLAAHSFAAGVVAVFFFAVLFAGRRLVPATFFPAPTALLEAFLALGDRASAAGFPAVLLAARFVAPAVALVALRAARGAAVDALAA